jgi:transposase
MPKKKHLVTLADDERQALEHLLPSGTHATRKVTRARILLKAAEGWEDQAIAAALSVGRATVERLRQRFVEEGLGALADQPRPGMLPQLDAKAKARLIAEACRAAPAGRQRWTLQLLAARVVALGLTEV